MKRWWTKNLSKLKKHKEKLARKSYRKRAEDEDPIHEDFRAVQNNYSKAIWKTKEGHWIDWLETLDKKDIWVANRMVSGAVADRGRSRILTLQVRDPITK